jgi:hypothetical protein
MHLSNNLERLSGLIIGQASAWFDIKAIYNAQTVWNISFFSVTV